ncbi:MAG: adenylyltransferase/cytidyltransferase family protein [Candidatus Saccharibacteria bacterium]
MAIEAGIFSNGSCFDERYIPDFAELARLVNHMKGIGLKIVLTSGSFDFFHLGHALYLEKAREKGDVLIVGVDSDAKIARKKGPNRPLYPQLERLQILVRQRSVDIVTLKEDTEEKWVLIKALRPDVLIATQETYSDDELEQLKEFCGSVTVLEPQAQTSTSKRLRDLNLELASDIGERLADRIPGLLQEVLDDAVGRHDKPKAQP